MLSYCLKCRRNIENKNPSVATTKTRRIMIYENVKSVMVKNQNLSNNKKIGDY